MLEIVSLLLGIVSIAMAIYSMREARKTDLQVRSTVESTVEVLRQAQAIKDFTQTIDRNLRTKYIGRFPACFTNIVECVEGATKSIHIVCDYPCYGLFSDYKTYTRYSSAIHQKAASNVQVSIIVPSADFREKLQIREFGNTPADWDRLRRDGEFRDKLRILSEHCHTKVETIDDFHRCLLNLEEAVKAPFTHLVQQVDGIPPIFIWVVDGNRAVFTIPQFGPEGVEHGFQIDDPAIADALDSIWKDYHRMPRV